MTRLLMLLGLLSLAACTTVPPRQPETYDPKLNQAVLLSQNQWQAKGRVLVRQPSDSWKATLAWAHNAGDDRLVISTALGGVLSIFESVGSQVTITDDQGRTRTGHKQVLLAELGLDVPLDSTAFWVRGLADPRLPATPIEVESGLVKAFRQQNWVIEYDRFDWVDGAWLPHKITLKSEGLLVRFVVDFWGIL